ncbi:MAG: hypothetical protein CM1200mP18_04300 [Gammaproteobacteria bacterium]|nr:MAG: hypothetical protein CM1200mP18_04300 [Gammaproteobacteria bacterium]
MTELDWCKLQFDASDLKNTISWKQFLKKGYYVVPAEAENLEAPVGFNWYAEGRRKTAGARAFALGIRWQFRGGFTDSVRKI